STQPPLPSPGPGKGSQLTLPSFFPPLLGGTLSLVSLPLGPQAVAASQNVGPLFPLITPSPVPAASPGIVSAFPVITPSPPATSSAGPPRPGQVPSGCSGQDAGLDLTLPMFGSSLAR